MKFIRESTETALQYEHDSIFLKSHSHLSQQFTILISQTAYFSWDANLALVGFEAISVVVILVVIFLWGPQKLPEMARSIGLAKREFEKASKELTSPSTYTAPIPTSSSSTQPPTDPLIVAAKSLGIITEGKTKEEIAKEIAARST
jgi:sec-independent protein translocase protein TatA